MILNIWVKKMKKDKLEKIGILILSIIIIFIGLHIRTTQENKQENVETNNQISYEISNIPKYSGEIYVEINNNISKFSNEDMNIVEDYYSNLENKKVRKGYDKN